MTTSDATFPPARAPTPPPPRRGSMLDLESVYAGSRGRRGSERRGGAPGEWAACHASGRPPRPLRAVAFVLGGRGGGLSLRRLAAEAFQEAGLLLGRRRRGRGGGRLGDGGGAPAKRSVNGQREREKRDAGMIYGAAAPRVGWASRAISSERTSLREDSKPVARTVTETSWPMLSSMEAPKMMFASGATFS